MRLLLDERLSPVVAEQLRGGGHDVIAVTELPDLRGLPDPDLFEHAQGDGRAIVTYNRDDFLGLDRQFRHAGRGHCGIVILNPRRFPQGPASTNALVASMQTLLAAEPPYPGFVHWLQPVSKG